MRKIKKYWAIILVLIVYVALLITYFVNFHGKWSIVNSNWGAFGDFFGGSLSPLIGIISIVLTYNIINNQTNENRQSEFKYMFQILFNSIDQKREVIEHKVRTVLNGNKAIKRVIKDIESVYTFQKKKNPTGDSLALFQTAFWSVYDDINSTSGPYMKVLHNCLKSIDNNCTSDRREEYAALLRAQLHPDELMFIFFNGIASTDHKSMKKRIEKYSLLKDISHLPIPEELKALYDPKAFQEIEKPTKKYFHYNRHFSFELKFTFKRS